MQTTRAECIDALERAAARLGESPTKAQYEELGLRPASGTILRVMGGWNDAKEAAGLETTASTGPRVDPKPDDVELPEGLQWEELSQDQRCHYRNRERNARRTRERRGELRRFLHTYKKEHGGCARCEVSDPACLDFHHVETTDKRMNVSEMVTYGYARERLREEIRKCELLCSNCHQKEHHEPPSSTPPGVAEEPELSEVPFDEIDRLLPDSSTKAERLRVWTRLYRQHHGCDRCSVEDPRCLQFHHAGDEKTMSVSTMISNSDPVEEVVAEVANCVVLCANCHRREHYADPTSGENDRP